MSYNSQIYDLQLLYGDISQRLIPSTTGGWRYSFQYSFGEDQRLYNSDTGQPDCSTADTKHQFKQYLVFPDGSRHTLRMDVLSQLPSGAQPPVYPTPSVDDYNLYNADGIAGCSLSPAMTSRPVLYTDDGTSVRVVTQRVIQQFTGTVTITAGATAPGTTVTLSATGVPAGWTVTFNPAQVTVSAGSAQTSTVTITPPSNAGSGTYQIGIVGTSGTTLAEPSGSPHNYGETVLSLKPDLIISEFVNDAGLKPPQVEERYGQLLADFKRIGAEWIILTPHYVRPDWMALTRERDIDEDPRPYVAGLRQFAATHDVALADA